jgi:hypothetical protein
MNRLDIKFLLLAFSGILAVTLAVVAWCLLPWYVADSGSRACLRWLRVSENQQALRLCADNLLKAYPGGSPSLSEGGVPVQRVPEVLRRIPPPRSGWCVVVPATTGSRHIELFSPGGFGSYLLYVGSTNFVMEGAK